MRLESWTTYLAVGDGSRRCSLPLGVNIVHPKERILFFRCGAFVAIGHVSLALENEVGALRGRKFIFSMLKDWPSILH